MKDQPLTEPQLKALEAVTIAFNVSTNAGCACLEQAVRNIVLLNKKQQDYGPRNISSFGVFGVLIRMNDKLERLKTLMSKSRRRKAQNESIRDSFVDISNYGLIAIVIEDNKWPT